MLSRLSLLRRSPTVEESAVVLHSMYLEKPSRWAPDDDDALAQVLTFALKLAYPPRAARVSHRRLAPQRDSRTSACHCLWLTTLVSPSSLVFVGLECMSIRPLCSCQSDAQREDAVLPSSVWTLPLPSLVGAWRVMEHVCRCSPNIGVSAQYGLPALMPLWHLSLVALPLEPHGV